MKKWRATRISVLLIVFLRYGINGVHFWMHGIAGNGVFFAASWLPPLPPPPLVLLLLLLLPPPPPPPLLLLLMMMIVMTATIMTRSMTSI